jgi:hypothetical protein
MGQEKDNSIVTAAVNGGGGLSQGMNPQVSSNNGSTATTAIT